MLDISERDVVFALGVSCTLFVALSVSMMETFEDARIEALKDMCVRYAQSEVPAAVDGDVSSRSFTVLCVDEPNQEEAFNVSYFMPEVLVR